MSMRALTIGQTNAGDLTTVVPVIFLPFVNHNKRLVKMNFFERDSYV